MSAAAALLILPVSPVGRIPIGGDWNSFHSGHFMTAAAGGIAARWTSAGKPAAPSRSRPPKRRGVSSPDPPRGRPEEGFVRTGTPRG